MTYTVKDLKENGWVIVETLSEYEVVWELGDWRIRHNIISGEILDAYPKGGER